MQMTLRPALPGDAEAVADLYLASRRAFVGYAPLAHTEAQVRGWVANVLLPGGGVTLAVDGGRVLGMAAVARQGEIGWLEQLYVAPGVTGQRVGTHLLAHAKAQMGPPLRLCVFQENSGAQRFYERHGFRLLALSDGQDNEEHCPDALYEWTGDASGAAMQKCPPFP